nr:hypothetical protein [Tanacetum cinerariifolium]
MPICLALKYGTFITQSLETPWLRYQVEGYIEDIVHDFEQRLDTIFGRQEKAKDGFKAYWLGSTRAIPDKRDLRDYWTEVSSDRDFMGPTPSYIYITDPVRRLCHGLISFSISGRGQALEKIWNLYHPELRDTRGLDI